MALTPEDVVNKRFQPTKFREGYDQDEVDDFLDEVVVELRRLNQENEELRQRLVGSDSRISELQRTGGQPETDDESAESDLLDDEPTADDAGPEAPVESAPTVVAAAPTYAQPSGDADGSSTNNLLQLARRLHEEHVREGVEKREALVAEGEEKRAELIAEGEQKRDALIADAEQVRDGLVSEGEQKRDVLVTDGQNAATKLIADAEAAQKTLVAKLESERVELEGQIDDLRSFEHEYRLKLKSYIEGQLQELESTGTPAVNEGASS